MSDHGIFWYAIVTILSIWAAVVLASAIYHYVVVHKILRSIDAEAKTLKYKS